MTPFFIISTIILGILVFIEARYSPRIDITKDGDILLWYNSRYDGAKYRDYKPLFKLK